MNKALGLGVIKERFTFHDLRAKAGSDSESDEDAKSLLGHSTPQRQKESIAANRKK
jgi:hypothetical protein